MIMKTGGGGGVVSSSPGREKLPAPPGLARLLYGKAVGGRSRGRSGPGSSAARSSPMMVSRSRSRGRSSSVAAAAAAEAGEPSSPKVTCIGQVRIRNKRLAMPRRSLPRKARSEPSLVMPCRCFHKGLLCGLFAAERKRPTAAGGGGGGVGRRRSLWRRWCCIRSGRSASRYQQRKQDSLRPPPPPPLPEFMTSSANKVSDREEDGDAVEEKEAEEDEDEDEAVAHEGEADVFMPSATASPPKNALLLMRCRSAPHNRASSLSIARFAVSPVPSPDPPSASPAPPPVNDGYQQQQQERDQMSSARDALAQEGGGESTEEEQADEANGSESRRPLVLPRSKSEPARGAAAKLSIPEATSCFWPSHSNGGNRRRRSSPAHDDQLSPAPAPHLADT